jgi:hypothetical protein
MKSFGSPSLFTYGRVKMIYELRETNPQYTVSHLYSQLAQDNINLQGIIKEQTGMY